MSHEHPRVIQITNDEVANAVVQKRYMNEVSEVLKVFLDVVNHELKNDRYNENLLRACTWAFDPNAALHKNFYQLKKEHYERKWTNKDEWRGELKKDDFVDVRVKVDTEKE